MKHLFMLSCLLLACGSSRASGWLPFGGRPSLPEIVQASHVICIGTVQDVQLLNKIQVDTGRKYTRGGPNSFVPAQAAIAEFNVDVTLAGVAPGAKTKIAFYKNVTTGLYPPYFVEFSPGERVVVFLGDGDALGGYQLAAPSSFNSCKIQVGAVSLPAATSMTRLTSLRRTMLVLASALAKGDSDVRLDCLHQLQSVGPLLYGDPPAYRESGATKLRAGIGEPPGSGLEDFVRTQILPAVVKLTTAPDAKVQAAALHAAIELQDADVLPALIRSDPSAAAFDVRDLRVPSSVYVLVPLLKSQSAAIRSAATYALWQVKNPIALPFLIDNLGETDADARHILINALIEITGDIPEPTPPDDAGCLAFWRAWKVKHKDQLVAERAQFIEESRPPPAMK